MFLLGIILLYMSKKWKANPRYDTVCLNDGSKVRVKRYREK